ncbi:hypothetical protein ACFE04_004065 [Oxalis oulophora]
MPQVFLTRIQNVDSNEKRTLFANKSWKSVSLQKNCDEIVCTKTIPENSMTSSLYFSKWKKGGYHIPTNRGEFDEIACKIGDNLMLHNSFYSVETIKQHPVAHPSRVYRRHLAIPPLVFQPETLKSDSKMFLERLSA